MPFKKRVVRRWVASYYAPNFLMPPLELMSLGAIVKEWKKEPVFLIDAVAEKWNISRVINELRRLNPDLLVTMPGFNIFPQDMETLNEISACLPKTKVICFGYLPTQFPDEVLKRTRVDIIIKNEPEFIFSEVYDCLKFNRDLSQIKGIAYKDGENILVNNDRDRIKDLDSLPFPDHSLINLKYYSESFLDRPIGIILSERGCPYSCTYCVRTYGKELVSRSADNILNEIDHLFLKHKIKNIRFLDDTFTLNKKRLHAIVQGILDRNLNINWTCLTRLDNLDRESLELMKRSGCKRIYLGIESGSQEILDYYKKHLTLNVIKEKVFLIKESGIEISAFFIVGAPSEDKKDVEKSIKLAKDLNLDYVIVTKLQYWPGTELFDGIKQNIKLDIFSSKGILEQISAYKDSHILQKYFYKDFYLNPRYIFKRFGNLMNQPLDILTGFKNLIRYLYNEKDTDDFI